MIFLTTYGKPTRELNYETTMVFCQDL